VTGEIKIHLTLFVLRASWLSEVAPPAAHARHALASLA
jgi:hypothetical protein